MMLTWWIIGVLAFVIFFAIFKSQDLVFVFGFIRKNLFPFFVIVILLFISFSFYRIYVNYDLNLKSFEGITMAGKLYFRWFLSIFDNFGKITGYAVNQDWVLNSTNITK